MPVPLSLIVFRLISLLFPSLRKFLILFGIGISSAWALVENSPIHFSGDKQVWDRKLNRVELFGHASVNQPGETLTADYIFLDLNARVLDARGNCVYITGSSVIWGEEMHFDIDTRLGSVKGGRISNDSFTLRGQTIQKMGDGHFKIHWGDYTTCHDCSASWSFLAESIELKMDDYAYLSNVTTRFKGAPMVWLPYTVVPLKTSRQTGFLIPKFGQGQSNGFSFILPFFWDMDRSYDMTFGLGEYSQRGHRLEWEGAYALSSRSVGRSRFYFLTDRQFGVSNNRWALDIEQTQDLPFGIEEKLRITEVSDNFYPFFFSADVPRATGEAFLPSTLSFSRSSPDFTAYVALQRNRNLLNTTPNDRVAQLTQFDPRTVQAVPSVMVSTKDRFLFGSSLVGGVSFGFTRFARSGGPFDFDQSSVPFGTPVPAGLTPTLGVDPIRQASRLSLVPSLYVPLRPFDVISFVPSLQYRSYFYNFSSNMPDLNRGYLLFQTDLSTQFEKIFDFPEDPDVVRAKHLIRPLLTYSYIPFIQEDENHPFIQQIKQKGRGSFTSGYNFDNNDIIPYSYQKSSANYFIPLGHSLAYGFTTQWIRKKRKNSTYQNAVEFNAGQAIDFLEVARPVDPSTPHVFTRLFSEFKMNYDHFSSQTTYYYYPDLKKYTLTTSTNYIIDKSMHQRVLTFDRSFGLAYTFNTVNGVTSNLTGNIRFSLSDYILPFASISFSFLPVSQFLGGTGGVQLQSPSRCWAMTANMSYAPGPGFNYSFDFNWNFAGTGFGSITQLTDSVGAASQRN